MRILLLARTAGDWWTSLALESPELEAILVASPPLILRAFEKGSDVVERIYGAAVRVFCNHLGACEIHVRRRQFAGDVTPLEVQMFALLDVLELSRRSDPHGATWRSGPSVPTSTAGVEPKYRISHLRLEFVVESANACPRYQSNFYIARKPAD